jgi:HAMP domain-containing protein/HPt (histidine-containing phosphotransfer) domain-containing protein
MRASLGTKLALATACVLAVASTLLFLELTRREWRGLLSAKTHAASMIADLFAATVAAPVDFVDSDPDALRSEIAHLEISPDLTCATVWGSRTERPLGELDRGGCDHGTAPSDDDLGTFRVTADRVLVARAIRSSGSGRAIGRLSLVFSLASENGAYTASRRRIFALSFALAAVTTFLLIVISRRQIVAPLEQLTREAGRIGRGHYSGQVEVRARDEIGQLARAFNSMREALADREHKLEAARQELRDLFDHMRQAIFAFGRDGRVSGATSRQANLVFGLETLEGARVHDLLYGSASEGDVDAQAFEEWLSMAFDVALEEWPRFAQLAPHEVTLRRDGKEVPLEIEVCPVVKDGALERVMVLATDVSEKRSLELTVQTQEEEHARRMAAMRRLIAGGGQVFVQFMEAARERLARCIELVGDRPRMLRTGEIDEVFRHVHTVKGEARAFDLRDLEEETAKLEEELDELRALARGEGFATTGSSHGHLKTRLGRALAAIDRGAEVFVEASPIGHAALEQVTVQRPDVQALMDLAGSRADTDLSRAVDRLAARPFGESTASLIDMAPTWGDREGRPVRLVVEGREVRVPPKLARVLGAVLTHLVRNAIAHGIEPAPVREDAGKPATGTISVTAVDGGTAGPTIVVEDDGRGLDATAIAERAAQLGIKGVGTGSEISKLVFVAGLSTAREASALAGRGVGLGAVREDLDRAGYAIGVTSKPKEYTRFTITPRS